MNPVNGFESQLHPKSFVRLTDKPNGYEPLITRSNRVQKTITEVMELADIAVLETAALVHKGSTPFFGTFLIYLLNQKLTLTFFFRWCCLSSSPCK